MMQAGITYDYAGRMTCRCRSSGELFENGVPDTVWYGHLGLGNHIKSIHLTCYGMYVWILDIIMKYDLSCLDISRAQIIGK